MRSRRSVAGATLLVGGILAFLVASTWRPSAAQDNTERDDIDTLQTQVAELQTQVAVLQTQIASLQPTAIGSATPSVTQAVCGRPFASWGGATADDVEVQVLQVKEATVPDGAAGTTAIAIELAITNHGQTAVTYRLEDFEVADCNGQVTTAVAGGPEPALGSGELAPGASVQGWVLFTLPVGAQAADFTFHIGTPERTGAQVMCPLVDRDAPPADLNEATGSVGCSAIGGSA
jgi:hypothetical protein